MAPRGPYKPRGLGEAGAKLWKAVTDGHELRPDERRILEDACREADLIECLEMALRVDLAEGNVKTRGSMGQEVINPLIGEIRQHRVTLATLLGKLKLTDDAADRSTSPRAAANARWQRRGA